jgi:hypothetical protein
MGIEAVELRSVQDWCVYLVIGDVRAAVGAAVCGLKCDFSRRREEM